MNPTKASGPDLINPRLLKEAAPIIKYPFVNYSISLYGSLPIQANRNEQI
jgi:hypothetical protein